MAVLNLNKSNLAAAVLNWAGSTANRVGLNLGSKTLTNNQVRQSDDIKALKPLRGQVIFQLTSGTLTVKALTGSAAAPSDFSGAATSGAISDTNEHAVPFATTSTNNLLTLQLTAGGSGCVINRAYVVMFDELPTGGGFHEATYAFNGLDPAKTSATDYAQ